MMKNGFKIFKLINILQLVHQQKKQVAFTFFLDYGMFFSSSAKGEYCDQPADNKCYIKEKDSPKEFFYTYFHPRLHFNQFSEPASFVDCTQ
jgi:hypothetical protein